MNFKMHLGLLYYQKDVFITMSSICFIVRVAYKYLEKNIYKHKLEIIKYIVLIYILSVETASVTLRGEMKVSSGSVELDHLCFIFFIVSI